MAGIAESYIIAVSPGVGCYRHIRVDADATLYDFHEAIQDAFEFDDDHAHAFFMSGRAWDITTAIYCPMMGEEDEDYVLTSEVELGDLDLKVGKKFLYLFDFGDEWRFTCKVLRLLPEPTPEPVVVRSLGAPPPQYPNEADWENE